MAAEPETYNPDLLAEEEPKYLRRQKPLEIRRRKLGRRTWKFYGSLLLAALALAAGGWAVYGTWEFFAYSPRVILARPDQIVVTGNHFVSRQAVLEKFKGDRGRSVVRVPLGERRRALEEIPWVEQANVERVLPNHIRVELAERTPIAHCAGSADERPGPRGLLRRHSRTACGPGVSFPRGQRNLREPAP